MHIKRILTFLLASAAGAQQNPTQTQFVAAYLSAMAEIRNLAATMPQPKIALLSAQHLAANLNALSIGNSGSCNPLAAYGSTGNVAHTACAYNNATAMNLYTDAMARAGAREIAVNFDPAALIAAAEYSPPSQYRLASDCPGAATYAYGAAPPAGAGAANWQCGTLYNDDQMIAHAINAGIIVRLRPKPDNVVALASSAYPSGLTSSNFTMADYENVAKPLYVAALARWGALMCAGGRPCRLTIIHEAHGGFDGSVGLTVTLTGVHQFVVDTAAALQAQATAMGITSLELGASSETMHSGDQQYLTDNSTSCGGGPCGYLYIPALTYVGTDLYGSTCLVSGYAGTLKPAPVAQSGALATAAAWAILAKAAGKKIDVEESAPPRYLPANCSGTQDSQTYLGGCDQTWMQLGLHAAYFDAVVPYLSALGYRVFSFFNSQDFVYYTNTANNPSGQCGVQVGAGNPFVVMANVTATTPTAAVYAQIGQGSQAQLQGKARTSGRVRLGH